jgi:hypothetical protein
MDFSDLFSSQRHGDTKKYFTLSLGVVAKIAFSLDKLRFMDLSIGVLDDLYSL